MDLNILSAGASKGLVESLQAQFRAETGVGIHGTFGAVGAIKEKRHGWITCHGRHRIMVAGGALT